MKVIAPLLLVFSLIPFTTPDGNPIYINRDQVVAITVAHSYDCKEGALTKIITSNGYSCVKEILENVRMKLDPDGTK